MPKKKVVVFDFDGVLIITPRELISKFQDIERALGLRPHSLEAFVEQWGKSWRDFWGTWYKESLVEEIGKHFFESVEKKHEAADELNSTLDELEAMSFRLGIISNHEKAYLNESLAGAGIEADRFDFILGSGERNIKKPDWQVFSKLPKETEKVIYVGDTDIDYHTVQNAQKADEFSRKITFIGVSQARDDKIRRLFTKKLKEAGVPENKILGSLSELPAYLEGGV
jgi:HAD superfamily hydrolase (TIGR01549 family)